MKITVHSLTTELDNCGTETRVFASLAELNAEFEQIILDRIDTPNVEWSADETEAIAQIRDFLEHDEIEDAWELFRDYDGNGTALHSDDDCFWWDEHEIDVALPGETVPEFFGIHNEQAQVVGVGRSARLAWANAQARAFKADKNAVVDSESHSVGEISRAVFDYERWK